VQLPRGHGQCGDQRASAPVVATVGLRRREMQDRARDSRDALERGPLVEVADDRRHACRTQCVAAVRMARQCDDAQVAARGAPLRDAPQPDVAAADDQGARPAKDSSRDHVGCEMSSRRCAAHNGFAL
jgi:hypothetical protein